MFGNYFKVAYRNLIRSKLYTVISVVGLAAGIACCILIFLYVQNELSYDRFHANADDIYRPIRVRTSPDGSVSAKPYTSGLLGPLLESYFPEVVRSTRIVGSQQVVRVEDKSFSEALQFVDPGFLEMFTFPLLSGKDQKILSDPTSLVITTEIAHKYFGNTDPIGQLMELQLDERVKQFTVAGVTRATPSNSSIDFDFLVLFENVEDFFPPGILDDWENGCPQTFVQFRPGTDIEAFKAKLNRHIAGLTEDIQFNNEDKLSHRLQPLTDIHLNPVYAGVDRSSSNPMYSYILSGIALTILLIACINFTTLAVGRASGRAREVGVRKAVGADRGQLMKQFLSEALLLSLGAMLIGIVLAELMLPAFNQLSQKELALDLWSNWIMIPALLLMAGFTAAVAGAYPSVYQSRLPAVMSLKGKSKAGRKTGLVRVLVVVQFVVSVFLIIATLTMSKQMSFITTRDLGYDKQWVMTLPIDATGEKAAATLDRFRGEISGRPEVLSVTGYSFPLASYWLRVFPKEGPGMCVTFGEEINKPAAKSGIPEERSFFYANFVDYDYLNALGVKLIEGRNFSREFPSDGTGSVVINQAAMKAFGWEDAVGRQLPFGFDDRTVIGVMEDFHFYPVHRQIDPLVLRLSGNSWLTSIGEIAVRISSQDVPGTISLLEQTWKQTAGGLPFSYSFLDEEIATQYAAERRWERIVLYAAGFALAVACLGLFGVASLAVARRQKEIGIRKVVGATVCSIVRLLLKEFAFLVVISALIASPIAYLVMSRWLENFAYRTSLSATVFAVAGLLALLIAVLAVSYQAIRAALANPVETLRYE
jgi:putative ABC transport system permease protein